MLKDIIKGKGKRQKALGRHGDAHVSQHRSMWSINIGTVSEIPIRIHASFLILLVWLVFATNSPSPLMEVIFVLIIFSCVLLHELGHALVAKRFGVQTRDITLYPFGGVASITSQPSARGELVIALAGPLVNVVIALLLYPWITLPDISKPGIPDVSIGARIFLTNVALAVFNLLPALPMDGGRVLRAALTLLNVEKPTRIAARVSQALCILLGLTALYLEQPMLFVIALLVFLGAMQEHVRAETTVMAAQFRVQDAMIPKDRLESFPHGTTITSALGTALTSWQPIYPVLNGEELVGIVSREDILEHSANHTNGYIGELIDRSLPRVEATLPLSDACAMMEGSATHVVIVTRDGTYAGLLAYDRLTDFLFMHEIRQRIPNDDDLEWSPPT